MSVLLKTAHLPVFKVAHFFSVLYEPDHVSVSHKTAHLPPLYKTAHLSVSYEATHLSVLRKTAHLFVLHKVAHKTTIESKESSTLGSTIFFSEQQATSCRR